MQNLLVELSDHFKYDSYKKIRDRFPDLFVGDSLSNAILDFDSKNVHLFTYTQRVCAIINFGYPSKTQPWIFKTDKKMWRLLNTYGAGLFFQ